MSLSNCPIEFNPDTLDLNEKEPIHDWNWNFMEWYHSIEKKEENLYVTDLTRMIHENWDKVAIQYLMQKAQEYYNKKIRPFYKECLNKPWPMKQIYNHFTKVEEATLISNR